MPENQAAHIESLYVINKDLKKPSILVRIENGRFSLNNISGQSAELVFKLLCPKYLLPGLWI